jgi:hypothetical protein
MVRELERQKDGEKEMSELTYSLRVYAMQIVLEWPSLSSTCLSLFSHGEMVQPPFISIRADDDHQTI